jgi:hypothetical protein
MPGGHDGLQGSRVAGVASKHLKPRGKPSKVTSRVLVVGKAHALKRGGGAQQIGALRQGSPVVPLAPETQPPPQM